MRLVIDISKDRYDEIMAMDWKNCRLFFDEELRAIHDGKALDQEPCDDAISRQAVIDAIEDDNRNGHYSCFATNNDAQCFKDVIRELPSVTPQPKIGHCDWIPVSERLPEEYKEVIVTDIETSDTYLSRYIGNGYWECDNGLFNIKNRIIAWQSKPEPYQPEIQTGVEGSDKE